jgi:hypothetical protein
MSNYSKFYALLKLPLNPDEQDYLNAILTASGLISDQIHMGNRSRVPELFEFLARFVNEIANEFDFWKARKTTFGKSVLYYIADQFEASDDLGGRDDYIDGFDEFIERLRNGDIIQTMIKPARRESAKRRADSSDDASDSGQPPEKRARAAAAMLLKRFNQDVESAAQMLSRIKF